MALAGQPLGHSPGNLTRVAIGIPGKTASDSFSRNPKRERQRQRAKGGAGGDGGGRREGGREERVTFLEAKCSIFVNEGPPAAFS